MVGVGINTKNDIMISDEKRRKAIQFAEEAFPTWLEELKNLSRIPSVSFDGFDSNEVEKSAIAVADLFKRSGLDNVEILRLDSPKNVDLGNGKGTTLNELKKAVHPAVYGEKIIGSNLPTVLLYAHHDVQPPGRQELWKSNPFEPVLRDGPGGSRLYGRGTADDKAGILVHIAAIQSYLRTIGTLPVNVKIFVEGEEEVGSSHLPLFLEKYRQKLNADIMILTDTANFDCGIPSLTISLRGLVGIECEVRALEKTVHSGMWGGPVPDAAMGLVKSLSTLTDENGTIAVPSIRNQIRPLSEAEVREYGRVPFNEEEFRKQVGLVKGVRLLKDQELNPNAQIWRYPSLTINAIQSSSRAQAGNTLNDSAWARVTIRMVPDMDPIKTKQELEAHIRKNLPWGLQMNVKSDDGASAWSINPEDTNYKSSFDAAKQAMRDGYGSEPLLIGCGGTIPFVKPFASAMKNAPVLMVGVEDPYTNAHGENESLLVSDFKKACLSQIHLFANLGGIKVKA